MSRGFPADAFLREREMISSRFRSNFKPATLLFRNQFPAQAPNLVSKRLVHGSSFDTFRFIQKLESDGFTREQAEAILTCLSEVMAEANSSIVSNSVPLSEYERTKYQQLAAYQSLQSEITLQAQNDFTLIRSDLNRVQIDMDKLKRRMSDEIRKIEASVRLDLAVEKSRLRDDLSLQELKIRDSASKIDSEVSQVRTNLETIKWEMLRTLIPLFCATGALMFSYLRFVK